MRHLRKYRGDYLIIPNAMWPRLPMTMTGELQIILFCPPRQMDAEIRSAGA